MALTQNVIVNQVFVGASTAGGFSLGDLRTLGFFEANEPVSLGSCFLDYRTLPRAGAGVNCPKVIVMVLGFQ